MEKIRLFRRGRLVGLVKQDFLKEKSDYDIWKDLDLRKI
jgi:hypothetical protein